MITIGEKEEGKEEDDDGDEEGRATDHTPPEQALYTHECLVDLYIRFQRRGHG